LWERVPENAARRVCPACSRIHERRPAAALILSGSFVETHRQAILNAARRVEAGAREQDPLQRIMDVEDRDAALLITTTEIQLARDIGEVLREAYGGETDYDYREGRLEVSWRS
jgi:NMD protein affecting ribosome stability and mRNA decay